MLKKAGIVVLGATAGMLSLAPLASAGEAPQRNNDHGHHHDGDHGGHHHGGHHKHDRGPRGCDGDAALLNVSCIGNDADINPINVGGDQVNVDDDDDDGRDGRDDRGGPGGRFDDDDDALINVSDILQRPEVGPINALGDQANIDR
ncbi:hypothetical protein [Actinomycetospora aeridis]|uniref:Uncharacterized protein n=1 Tax=Actinomycetospora aeridis TaxID=3129231 RepID=A0ABU8N737_9PSEU